jgi:hypothetical protein
MTVCVIVVFDYLRKGVASVTKRAEKLGFGGNEKTADLSSLLLLLGLCTRADSLFGSVLLGA